MRDSVRVNGLVGIAASMLVCTPLLAGASSGTPRTSASTTVVKPAEQPKVDDAAFHCSLNRRLPEINFNGNSLSDVADFFRDVIGAKISVDWRSLEARGIATDTPITLRLRNQKFEDAVATVLRCAGGEKAKLVWTPVDGVIVITAVENTEPKP